MNYTADACCQVCYSLSELNEMFFLLNHMQSIYMCISSVISTSIFFRYNFILIVVRINLLPITFALLLL